MKKIQDSQDVDVLLISLSDEAIAYAEEQEDTILHYSENNWF